MYLRLVSYMPRVNVKYFASLRELLNNTREEKYEVKDGTMLMDLILKHIPERHPKASRKWKERIFEMKRNKIKLDKDGTPLLGYYLILINGTSYRLISENGKRPGLRYKLKDGDDIAIFPPVGGG